MDAERHRQHWEIWGMAVVVSVAVLSGLAFKGLSGEAVSDAVKDIGAALIPILAAFVSARLVTGQLDPAERRRRAAEEALRLLAERDKAWLSGPKANSAAYDPENPGQAGRYLFYQQDGKGHKGQFIPLRPLGEGILELRVQAQTLKVLGVDPGPEGWAPHQARIVDEVRTKVLAAAERLGLKSKFEQLHPSPAEDSSPEQQSAASHDAGGGKAVKRKIDPAVALVVDFDEMHMKPAEFKEAILSLGLAAHEAIMQGAGRRG